MIKSVSILLGRKLILTILIELQPNFSKPLCSVLYLSSLLSGSTTLRLLVWIWCCFNLVSVINSKLKSFITLFFIILLFKVLFDEISGGKGRVETYIEWTKTILYDTFRWFWYVCICIYILVRIYTILQFFWNFRWSRYKRGLDRDNVFWSKWSHD